MTDTKQKEINLNLTIFKTDQSDIECNDNNDDPIKCCSALKRLVTGLKYYSLLNVITNQDHKQIFINFIKSVYTKFLDDYNHFLEKHDEQLEKINESLIQDVSFGDCNISKCKFATRHHKERGGNDNNNKFDGQFEFYKTTMDSLHFYLLHLFHVGLRAMKNKVDEKEQQEEEIKQEEDEIESFDNEFSRIVKAIKDGRDISDSFNRFKSNDKFNISVAAQSGS